MKIKNKSKTETFFIKQINISVEPVIEILNANKTS